MKTGLVNLAIFLLTLVVCSSPAAVLYVDVNSTNPVLPYTSWATAATNIQDAIDASTKGDLILVTNGVYTTGGKSMDGVITNRVSLDKAVTVKSVNGPFVTVIQGAGMSNGVSAVRCAWLTNNATLVGFTLELGATRIDQNSADSAGSGGGAWCASSSAILANCLIVSNTAYLYGGGSCQGTLDNCFISHNSAFRAGWGSYQGILNSCTVVSNVGFGAAAVAGSHLTNCVVYYNINSVNNFSSSTFVYCCTTPLPPGPGNFTNPPGLFVDGIHLTSTSPCIGAGTNVTTGTDIFGQPWANPPSIGCAEWQPEPVVMPPQIQLTGIPVGFSVGPVAVNGQPPLTFQWLKDGVPFQDDGHFSGSQTTDLIAIGIKDSDGGSYQLVASNAFGMVTSAVAQLVIHCVNVAGSNPQPPYTNWMTAATNIQDAIDAAAAGEVVLVTNGIYATGGRITPDGPTNAVVLLEVTNRVVVDKALTVVSVNGYSATTIQGAWDPVSTNGPDAFRCAWLTNGAVLSGFTLENGATETGNYFGSGSDDGGGGVYCASTNPFVFSTNVVVANCLLTNNSAASGGGICGGILNNSLVTGNWALYGGGAFGTTLNNCTVVKNYCETPYPVMGSGPGGGGTYDCAVQNSIVVNNYWSWSSLAGINNYSYGFISSSPLYSYSCTYPLPFGAGNIDGNNANPQFLDLFHIASTSPCRGAGSALYASGTDLDGELWANPPSMGCDEVVLSNLVGPLSVSLIASETNLLVSAPSYPPLAHYDFFFGKITGRVAYVTWSFGDGPTVTNLGPTCSHDWTNTGDYPVAFTAYNTDNPAGISSSTLIHVLRPSVPQLQPPLLSSNGFQFQFAGQSNADYTIQYTTNLAPPVIWQNLQTIYWNVDNVIQINDSAPTNAARFYRVLAQ